MTKIAEKHIGWVSWSLAITWSLSSPIAVSIFSASPSSSSATTSTYEWTFRFRLEQFLCNYHNYANFDAEKLTFATCIQTYPMFLTKKNSWPNFHGICDQYIPMHKNWLKCEIFIFLAFYEVGRFSVTGALNSVHLLAICQTKYIKKYGINAIFSAIMKDPKTCRNGYLFQVYSAVLHLRESLLALLAGTPVSQLGSGFKGSVGGAFRKCRFCIVIFKMMQKLCREEDFDLKTKEEHATHIELLDNTLTNF